MTGFQTNLDIMGRACQHVGARRFNAVTDLSPQAQEIVFAYDKLRAAELRRTVWRYATRRAVLRPITSTSLRFVPAAWASGAFVAGDIVMDSNGTYWICVVPGTGKVPGSPTIGFPLYWTQYFGPIVADLWSSATTYYPGDVVYKSGPVFYINLAVGATTVGSDPASGTPWHALAAPQATNAIVLPEPVGAGLTVNNRARVAYHLPNGFLRTAAPDPKVESNENLSTSGAMQFSDWQLEGNILVSASQVPVGGGAAGPIWPFRFVADVSDVFSMEPLFCEALGARIGFEVCERLTQSNIKLQAIAAAYQRFMKDARRVNQLEIGSTEGDEDDFELTKGPQNVAESPNQAQPQQG